MEGVSTEVDLGGSDRPFWGPLRGGILGGILVSVLVVLLSVWANLLASSLTLAIESRDGGGSVGSRTRSCTAADESTDGAVRVGAVSETSCLVPAVGSEPDLPRDSRDDANNRLVADVLRESER